MVDNNNYFAGGVHDRLYMTDYIYCQLPVLPIKALPGLIKVLLGQSSAEHSFLRTDS